MGRESRIHAAWELLLTWGYGWIYRLLDVPSRFLQVITRH
jgi:hypothetical protein